MHTSEVAARLCDVAHPPHAVIPRKSPHRWLGGGAGGSGSGEREARAGPWSMHEDERECPGGVGSSGIRLGRVPTAMPEAAADRARTCPLCASGLVVVYTLCSIHPMGLSAVRAARRATV